MKLDIYVCDRCGAELRMKEGKKPITVIRDAHLDEENRRIQHLCEDCDAGLSYFMLHVKEFDGLADAIAKREASP